ncbi:MAG TPA: Gfo/Idh/MocA family oxidoreductase [Roseiflexaceae bacterium]|nr:Gfo/Idh/MocA family oxidoreductase [Roseiflexaceae bacterium]
MDTLGVALLGLDHWYAAHDLARQIAESPRARLVAVADPDERRARWTAETYGAGRWTTDYRTALDHPDVQVVATLTSTDRNLALVREAAALGKHIISVKPMALDMAGADLIVQTVRAAGVLLFPLECLGRLTPDRRRLKQWIAEGRIGQPLRFTHTLNSSLPQAWPGSTETGWWTEPARVPGGAWIDHAIYEVDTIRWLFDSAPVSVSGVVANKRYPDLGMEDYGVAIFTLAGGLTALIEDTWTADRGYGFSRREIIGSAGAICEDTSSWGRVSVRGNFGHEGWMALELLGRGHAGVVEHLVDHLRGEVPPIATVEDGRANLAACLAFYEAARTGRTVTL